MDKHSRWKEKYSQLDHYVQRAMRSLQKPQLKRLGSHKGFTVVEGLIMLGLGVVIILLLAKFLVPGPFEQIKKMILDIIGMGGS